MRKGDKNRLEGRGLRWCDIGFEKNNLRQPYACLGNRRRLQADKMGIGNEDNFIFCLSDGSELSRSRVEVQLEMIEKHMIEGAHMCWEIKKRRKCFLWKICLKKYIYKKNT